MPSDFEYKIAKGMVSTLTKACYRIETSGLDHLHELKPPYIIAGNHHSTIDALIMGLFVPHRIHFLGKHSALWNNKTWATINDFFGTIPVHKKGGNDMAIKAGLDVLMKRRRVLGIFPEGAILAHRKAFEGKVGVAIFALTAGVPVVPVGILGTEDVLPYPEYGTPAVWPRVGKRVEFHVRAPLYFDNYSKDSKEDLRNVTDKIMKEIRIASKGYGCPLPLIKQLISDGILTKSMIKGVTY
jgi:1-acyl-sn-glycerol-3-phosphate acyltransferase